MKRLAPLVAVVLVVAACGSSAPSPTSTPVPSAADPVAPPPVEEAPAPPPADSAALPAPAPADSAAAPRVEFGADELYPDVLAASADATGEGTFTISATLSSPYDSPERYADAWRVVGPDGTVYGIRELGHDHASEQPFTRSLSGVEIPAGVAVVTIEGRDQQSGWGGATVELVIP